MALSDEEKIIMGSGMEKKGMGRRGRVGKNSGEESSSCLGSRRAAVSEMKRRPERRRGCTERVLPWKLRKERILNEGLDSNGGYHREIKSEEDKV